MNQPKSQRMTMLQQWCLSAADQPYSNIQAASSDASFRRYFRVSGERDGITRIVMDAPPDKEDCTAFVHTTELLRNAGVNAPQIIAQDKAQGFLLLSDLGDQQYLDHLNNDTADAMYRDALISLIKMQSIKNDLPVYDEQRLRDEMNLFEPWYLNTHLKVKLDPAQEQALESVFQILINNALEQAQVFVHRDYHSRNLMLLDHDNPGVIDYQDAVVGPITYDLVSLFKDCYIEWPRGKVEHWLDDYISKSTFDFERSQFIRWFDLMGVQRHLKVLGIFARLNYRDGKAQYLNDLPLTLKYVVDTCEQYDELKPLKKLLQQCVLSTA